MPKTIKIEGLQKHKGLAPHQTFVKIDKTSSYDFINFPK
jgi:hypothetical protein